MAGQLDGFLRVMPPSASGEAVSPDMYRAMSTRDAAMADNLRWVLERETVGGNHVIIERDIHDLIMQRDSINLMTDSLARTQALAKLMGPRNGVPLRATRVYLGRDQSKSALLSLSDPNGRTRIRLTVDSLGKASLEFLDEAGAVTSRLPSP